MPAKGLVYTTCTRCGGPYYPALRFSDYSHNCGYVAGVCSRCGLACEKPRSHYRTNACKKQRSINEQLALGLSPLSYPHTDCIVKALDSTGENRSRNLLGENKPFPTYGWTFTWLWRTAVLTHKTPNELDRIREAWRLKRLPDDLFSLDLLSHFGG